MCTGLGVRVVGRGEWFVCKHVCLIRKITVQKSVSTKNHGIVHSECDKRAWSSYDLENDKTHMSHYIVNRYGNFQRSVRVLYIILEFVRKLFLKVKPNKYIIHFDNLSDHTGKSSFILSYLICLSKYHSTAELCGNEKESGGLSVTRLNNESALYALIRETQLWLVPDLFLELQPQGFSLRI